MNRAPINAILLLLLLFSPAFGGEDERVDRLFTRYMPPCCYTGILRDHQSGSAEAMKDEIRAFVAEGKTDAEIDAYYVGLYGERILSEPASEGFNKLAVATPVAIVLAGLIVLGVILRKQKSRTAPAASSEPAEIDSDRDAEIEREIRKGM